MLMKEMVKVMGMVEVGMAVSDVLGIIADVDYDIGYFSDDHADGSIDIGGFYADEHPVFDFEDGVIVEVSWSEDWE